MSGDGSSSILKPLDVNNEALTLTGSGASASNLQMDSSATNRLTTWQSAMIWVDQAKNFTVQNVEINGSSSAGIYDDGGQNGLIQNNTVQNTLADSIANTSGASQITVSGNRIVNSGDDGISNNSYVTDPNQVNNITVTGNTILDNNWGRGLEASGGSDITFSDNYVDNTDGDADVYIASESHWQTQSVSNVTVNGNTLVDGGPNQGSVIIYNSETGGQTISGVTVSGNQFVNPKLNAVQYVGSGSETGITVDSNTDYSSSQFSTSSNSAASSSESGNQVLDPSTYSTPMVSPGGGVSSSTATTTSDPSSTTSTSAAATTDPTTGTSTTTSDPSSGAGGGTTAAPAPSDSSSIIAVNGSTINATGGDQMLFVTGHGDTINLGGGVATVTDSGSGGNTFVLPAAGDGSAVFNSAVLSNGDTFNLTAALQNTDWNGSDRSLWGYLHIEQSGSDTELLVSSSASSGASGTLLATFDSTSPSLHTIT